jgi:TPP-dependent indolepyruvate ferredoxin oxidoreductase alpha subunit
VQKADKVGDRIFIEGNSAAALGAVYGGATVCAWYPITPSSSLADAFTSHCKRLRHDPETKKAKYAIVQARTNSPRSASSSARRGTAPAPSPRPPAPASR